MQTLLQAVAFLLGIALPHWVIRWDERRLSGKQRRRGWNDASHWSAVSAFSLLCLPVHFYRTRKTLLGLLAGTLWTLLCAGFSAAILSGVEWLFG